LCDFIDVLDSEAATPQTSKLKLGTK